jgi:hypothetical protein
MSEYTPFPYAPNDHQAWESLLPFYLARTLTEYEAHALEAHLSTCASCRQALEDWRAIANATHHVAAQRSQQTPPMSQALRQQIYQEANQRGQHSREQLPPLRVMPRPTDARQRTPVTPARPVPNIRPVPRRSSPWLTRIAAVFVFVIAAGIIFSVTRERLATLSADPTQQVSVINNPTATMTPVALLGETTSEVTEQPETVAPSATPWNTVMPQKPSPTPTFTITPHVADSTATQVITTFDQANPVITIEPTNTASIVVPFTVDPVTPTRDRSSIVEDEPAIQQFSIVPNTVQPGQVLTVRWQTTGADTIEIAADYTGIGSFEVINVSDVSTDNVTITLPEAVREQVTFELRLYDTDDTGTAEAASASDTSLPFSAMTAAASAQVSIAIQCPYIYLLYGNHCPDDTATQLNGTVQRFENGWIIRRNDVGEGIVLFDNGTIQSSVSAEPVPTGTAPEGLFAPDPSVSAFYQTALGWAQAPAKGVVLHVSTLDAASANLADDGSKWFAISIDELATGSDVLSLELQWTPSTSGGNFSQWRSVS